MLEIIIDTQASRFFLKLMYCINWNFLMAFFFPRHEL